MGLVYSIARNDALVTMRATLTGDDGQPADLTGATVAFYLETADHSTLVIDGRTCTVLSPATAGRVEMTWQAADTATPGYYWGEFKVDYGGGQRRTFPTGGKLYMKVVEDVAQ